MLGFGEKPAKVPGSTTVHSKAPQHKWSDTSLAAFDCPPRVSHDTIVQPTAKLVAISGDTVTTGSNVAFYPDEPGSPVTLGCVHEMWTIDDP
ncbi:hypothetical protein RSOL_496730, partial [Rhizoctonia solani AG-3 Rhs1AP]